MSAILSDMDHRTGFCALQTPTDPRSLPADFDLGGYRLPAHPAQRASTGPRLRVRARPIRQTVVIEVAGRHVHDWKGTPVAVSSPDPRVREALKAHPLGSELIVTQSLL